MIQFLSMHFSGLITLPFLRRDDLPQKQTPNPIGTLVDEY